jgi:hypothetical protein
MDEQRMSHILVAFLGAALALGTWLSIIRTVFTPRERSSLLARCVVRFVATAIRAPARLAHDGLRERILDYIAPLSLILTGLAWVVTGTGGFALLAWSTQHVRLSAGGLAAFFLMRSDGVGLAVAAALSAAFILSSFTAHVLQVMIAYARREGPVARLAAQATQSPDAEVVLADYLRTGSRDHLDTMFGEWSAWLADLQASHLSYPAMPYFRPMSGLCWAKAALIVLDCAAIAEAGAPEWAPPNTRPLLAIGSSCLPRLAAQMGERETLSPVSYHGRETRPFADTFRLARKAGLPAERDERDAEAAFLRIRIRYAPYVIALGDRLLYDDVD